jgi:hypothetical protein
MKAPQNSNVLCSVASHKAHLEYFASSLPHNFYSSYPTYFNFRELMSA